MYGIGFRPLRNPVNPIRSCNRVENQSKPYSHFGQCSGLKNASAQDLRDGGGVWGGAFVAEGCAA